VILEPSSSGRGSANASPDQIIGEVIIDSMVRPLRASIFRRAPRALRPGVGTHPGGEFLPAQVIPSQALRSHYQFDGECWRHFPNRLRRERTWAGEAAWSDVGTAPAAVSIADVCRQDREVKQLSVAA
jgi:hypothetical protein